MDAFVVRLAGLVDRLRSARGRVTVAIDGADCAGKTTLADALAHQLGGHVVRASIDSFLNPDDVRRARGDLSADGCYRDSFDYARFRRLVLDPLSGDGAPAVLVVDGVFLLRPELRDAWTLSVHLDVSPEETVRRARVRDAHRFGDELERRYVERYLPAQEIYRAEADPLAHADVLVGYDDPARPDVRRWPDERTTGAARALSDG